MLDLVPPWNLIAVPRVPPQPAPADVLAPISGAYDLVYAYQACDLADPWKKFDPNAPPPANDMSLFDIRHGYWVRVAQTSVLPLPVPVDEIQFMESWGFLVTHDDVAWHYDLRTNRWENVGRP